MSRFDDELVRTAENAWQNSGAPAPTDAPGYDQVDNMYLDGPLGLSSQSPAIVDDTANWTAGEPMRRQLNVQDTVTPDIMGQPGSSAVFASKYDVDENLYQVYKASRSVRDAIEAGTDFDFTNLVQASVNCYSNIHNASNDQELVYTIGTIAGIVNEIENELVASNNYKQAYATLIEFEGLLEGLGKYAGGGSGETEEPDEDDNVVASRQARIEAREQRLASEFCPGPGCKTDNCDGMMSNGTIHSGSVHKSTNGNQETLQHDDVRALDNTGPYMQNLQADAVVDVTAPQVVNGEDAGYVPYYNDGAETGIVPGQGPHSKELDFNDATNPALAPYAGTVAGREKIFEALQVVERLEKLGMVENEDRMKHVAKFEQMSDAKLAGFRASLDMLEESGARQPRSQKVASGNNRMPEMGRLTTASTVTRQSLLSDDWLMTL